MVVGVLPVAALAEEPVSDTEPTTVPTETTASTEAVQADVSQYALTDSISTYDAFNCYVALIPDSTNAKPTGFKVKVGDTVNGYKVLSLNSRTYEVHIDIGVLQSESALPKFRIPLPEEIWTGVKATDSTWVLCVDHWKPGDTMKLDRGGNQMRYYSMGTEWYFSLNYDANGGSGAPAAQTHTTNTASETSYTFTIPQTVPTRKGYTFQGWSFEKNGTASYQPGQTCTLTRPKDGAITSTLYAVWEAVPSAPKKPTGADLGDLFNPFVLIDCIGNDDHEDGRCVPIPDSCSVTDPELKAGKYTCTVTVTAAPYVTAYSNKHGTHTLSDSPSKTITLTHDGTKWVTQDEMPIVFKVECEKDEIPDPDLSAFGSSNIQIKCVRDTSHDLQLRYSDGTYHFERHDDPQYGYLVFDTASYLAKYNEFFKGDHGEHELTNATAVVTLELEYKDGQWQQKVPNEIPTIQVTCADEPAIPEAPKFDELRTLLGKITVDCINTNAAHPDSEYDLIVNSYSATSPEKQGNVYICLVSVYAEKYVEAYNKAYSGHSLAGDSTSGKAKLVYLMATQTADGYTWSLSDSNPLVFNVKCDTAPVETFTVTYTDGVDGAVFADDVHSGLTAGTATPDCKHGNAPTRTGYIFTGWNPTVADTVTGNATYTATWKIDTSVSNNFVLKYDANGGTGAPADQIWSTLDTDITAHTHVISDTIPTREGYTFKGWSDTKYGNASHQPGQNCWVDRLNDVRDGNTITKTLYAVWEKDTPAGTYTVTYTDGVDDEDVFENDVHVGLNIGDPTPDFVGGTPTRPGYIFKAWDPAVEPTVSGNTTYTATWRIDGGPGTGYLQDFILKYDANGGTGAPADQAWGTNNTNISATTITISDTIPTREGYVFMGWSDTKDGNATHQPGRNCWVDRLIDDRVGNTVTKTLYAVWEEDANGNGEPDKDEEKYTVTYTDGVDGEEIFADKTYCDLLSGTATPKFDGTPKRDGYVFDGWNPAVADKVTGSQTYTATWKVDANGNGIPDDEEDKYTVTYTDGADGKVFTDKVYNNLLSGTATPAFDGTPKRDGYVFDGWNPAVADKVTGSQTYTATWKVDANGNGIPDDEEDKYTVTYTDGADGKVFTDKVYNNLLSGTATPAFDGTPKRDGYVFDGWNPAVADKVTGSQTYTATWKVDANGNGIADDEEEKYTVTYTDGVKGKAFADQVYDNLLSGTATPAFNGKPTRKGYTFVSWTPKVTDTVTKTVTYTATWKSNSGKDNVPKTGDSGIVPVLGSVLLFSFCGAAACVFDRKRKHI